MGCGGLSGLFPSFALLVEESRSLSLESPTQKLSDLNEALKAPINGGLK